MDNSPAQEDLTFRQQLSMPADIIGQLRAFEPFADIAEAELQWLVDHSSYYTYPAGSSFYRQDDAVDEMHIVLEGSYQLRRQQNGAIQTLGTYYAGALTGVLPFSRMTHSPAFLHCLEDCRCLLLHRSYFPELVTVSYKLAENLVVQMSNRIRAFSEIRSQDEKLMSLGRLSAGLAHELNNPASAIVRSAEELQRALELSPEGFKAVMLMKVTPEEVDAINTVLFARLDALDLHDSRSAIDQMDAADEIEDWMHENGVVGNSELTELLVQAKISASDLESFKQIVDGRSLASLIRWISNNISVHLLTRETREAARRISELVASVKSYTHMDRQTGSQPLDLHEGLRSTLIMLKHKIKNAGVSIQTEFGDRIPPVMAIGGQINQVFTNLIDNAVDAAGANGRVIVRSKYLDKAVCIEIEDNGPGIPDHLKERIFDPFFTTKPIGEGTGIGLDITRKILRRHEVDLELESIPGRTVFRFCLPEAS